MVDRLGAWQLYQGKKDTCKRGTKEVSTCNDHTDRRWFRKNKNKILLFLFFFKFENIENSNIEFVVGDISDVL